MSTNDKVQTQAFDGMTLELEGNVLRGKQGEQGRNGNKGEGGDSAYQIWLKEGNVGTEDDFLAAIQGPPGDDGQSLTNRGEWAPNVYGPGDYVFALGSENDRSMWIVMSESDFISQIEPRLDPSHWVEFSSQQGEPGVDGSMWFIRTTMPVAELGKTTDCWLNVTTGDVWQKTDTWGSPIGTLAGGGSGGGGVSSVNNKMPDSGGNVTLTPVDVGAATSAQGTKADSAVQPNVLDAAIAGVTNDLADVATSGEYTDLLNKPTLGTAAAANMSAFATATQGAKADSALQSSDVSTAGKSGIYNDLTGKPTLGTAAAQSSTAFATAAQGTKADTAVQPNQLATVAVSGAYADLTGKPALGTAASQPSTAFATAAQGTKADTAVQPGALAIVATSGSYNDLLNKPTTSNPLGRNELINGNFDIAQEAVLGNVSNAAPYTADQWMVSSSAVGITCNWGIGAPAVGEIKGATRFLGYNVVAGAGSAWIGQRIEGVQRLANGKATVSFWMRSGVAGKKVGLSLQQVFGSGGSTTVQTDGIVITLTTTFTKYTYTFDVPSVTGKTYGANHHLFLLFFLCDAGYFSGQLANQFGLFELAQVQFEEGPVATVFDFRDPETELALCQRYWEKSYDLGVYPGAISAFGRCGEFMAVTRSGAASALLQKYMVRKRTTPVMRVYSSESGALNNVAQDNGTDVVVNNISAVGETGFQVSYTNGSGRYGASFHYTANARI